MEINVRDDSKIVDIWLTNGEKDNAGLLERLKPLCQAYKGQGYLVTMFRSGSEDMTALTGALLVTNQRRMAEQAARRNEQQALDLAR